MYNCRSNIVFAINSLVHVKHVQCKASYKNDVNTKAFNMLVKYTRINISDSEEEWNSMHAGGIYIVATAVHQRYACTFWMLNSEEIKLMHTACCSVNILSH